MGIIKEDQVINALRRIQDDAPDGNIALSERVSGLRINDRGDVFFAIEVDAARGRELEPLRQKAEHVVMALPGVGKVSCVLTAEKAPPVDPHKMAKNPPLAVPAKNIIVVASGKGGVGKSTVSVNLATYLSNKCQLRDAQNLDKGATLKVGLLDADIYGPSIPKMMGCDAYRPSQDNREKLVPAQNYGLKIMSIGFMVDKEQALIWRGPMVQSALYQMIRDVAWAETGEGGQEEILDYLVIDLPPGTGDVQLTLAQKVPVTGAVIVSTPQDIALLDARKAVAMFKKTNVPILGMIENMSAYTCPNCGHESDIFGHGGAREEADRIGVSFLGSVPLASEIRLKSDEGAPIVLSRPDSLSARAFAEIAEKIIAATA